MNVTAVLFSILGIAVVLCSVIYVLVRKLNQNADENKRLKGDIAFLKKNLAYVVNHQDEITKIRNEQQKVKNQLENAKNDEEIADIIAGVIAVNNARMQNEQSK